MAVNLIKGQKVSLKKENGIALSRVMVGLGWDPVKKAAREFSARSLAAAEKMSIAMPRYSYYRTGI